MGGIFRGAYDERFVALDAFVGPMVLIRPLVYIRPTCSQVCVVIKHLEQFR